MKTRNQWLYMTLLALAILSIFLIYFDSRPTVVLTPKSLVGVLRPRDSYANKLHNAHTSTNGTLPLSTINNQIIWKGSPYSLQDFPPHVSLSFPVFVVGLPKAGTSSIHDFFRSAGYSSAHWRMNTSLPWGIRDNLIGICMRQALEDSRPLLTTCGGFDVWAQMDVEENEHDCVFPQISYLEQIHQEAPQATFLLNRRDLDRWANSVMRWKGAGERRLPLVKRLALCPNSVGPSSAAKEDLIDWNLRQVARIRSFVAMHPSHALMEIDIENPDTAQ